MDMNGIKAILFDSGRTLNVPRTGHWFITPNFFQMIGNAQISYTDKQLNEAMEKACEHINKKLKQYFSTFIMSSIYGSYQAEKTLFKIAIEELGIKPQEAIFVDDSESNLDAAKEFGMAPILIDRYDIRDLKSKYPIIRSLNELT